MLSNNSKYVSGKSVQKVSGKSVQSGFVRTPRSVQYDVRLSGTSVRVYGVLADNVGVGRTAVIGQRKIARKIGVRQETVGVALRELKAFGHIGIDGWGKSRRVYTLLSDVFGQAQGREDIIEYGPTGKRYVSLDNERHGTKSRQMA